MKIVPYHQKYKNDFKPVFKDKILFELTLNSIITFNLINKTDIVDIILQSNSEESQKFY